MPGANVNFDTNVVFIPGGVSIAAGGAIPPGTKLGGVHAVESLSLGNGACSSVTTMDFVLFNVALPNNAGNPQLSTNLAWPQVEGTVDRFAKWAIGGPGGGFGPTGIDPGVDADHAAGTSLPFQNYPKYLLDAFGSLVPHAAYGALTRVNGEWQTLYLLQFDAGALTTMPAPYSLMTVSMGAPLVWVAGDPSATLPSPSSITATCAPANITTTLLGRDPSATYTRATSPASAGTAFYMHYLTSLRDTDQDGYENAIDTCPLTVNTGNPKAGTGDADGDGVDDACDTNTPAPSGTDVDSDGYANRQDDCPQVANATQAESEPSAAADKGPAKDQMGDPCDSGPITIIQNGHSVTITAPSSVSNGRYLAVTNVAAKCFGSTDVDGDGYCTALDSVETGMCASTVPPSCTFRHNAWSSASPMLCVGCMDTDGDASTTLYPWTDAAETYLGTDPTKPCAQDGTANNEYPGNGLPTNQTAPGTYFGYDAWPLDFDDNQLVNGSDFLLWGAVLTGGSKPVNYAVPPGVKYNSLIRYDLNMDGTVTAGDLLKLNTLFGVPHKCGTGGSPVSAPPLVNGTAFQQ